ncbi:MAG: hypothetical protein OXF02_02120 [Simkaniaceae bacterium]|nr:hypothetical protein [Simkaniaceae bacterium]
MSCICCCPSHREPVIRTGVVEEPPQTTPPVTVQPKGAVDAPPEVRLLRSLKMKEWDAQVRREESFPGVTPEDAGILEVAGEVDVEMQRVLYEQAQALQEKREREKPEEIDWGLQQVLCREIYPEGGVGPVSEVRPDRR